MEDKRKGISEHVISISVVILSFIGGIVVNTMTITEKVATKPYVDSKFDEAKSYTDRVSVGDRQYSELTKKSMEIELQAAVSDVKADVKGMIVKQDLMFEMIKNSKEKK